LYIVESFNFGIKNIRISLNYESIKMSEEIESLRKIAKTIDTVCSIYLISFGLISNIEAY
jgi:hypothetical protein